MQEALRLLDNLGLSYFKIDMDGVLVEISDSLCAALGYKCEELIGQRLGNFVDPAILNEMMAQTISEKYGKMNVRIRRNGLGVVYGEATMARIEDESGAFSGYYGILEGLSNQKANYKNMKQTPEREMAIARRIQESFLPQDLPEIPGWELAIYFEAAQDVAGDFYDVFPLAGGTRIGLVIADVCDKGLGAALFMALIRSLLRAFADQHYVLGWMDVLDDFNEGAEATHQLEDRRRLLSAGATSLKKAVDLTHNYVLKNHGHTNMFATLFFAVIDPKTGVISYINAGHESPVVMSGGNIKSRLEPTGVAIGLPIEYSFSIQQIMLEPDDVLFAYTDGVTDARDPDGKFFTERRLLAVLQERTGSAVALVKKIVQTLKQHIAFKDAYDDITMLAIQRVSDVEGII